MTSKEKAPTTWDAARSSAVADSATSLSPSVPLEQMNAESETLAVETPATPSHEPTQGVGPWPGGRDSWPDNDRFDPDLLAGGDRRNVEDRYRYWTMDAIREDVASRALPFEIAIENLAHDFNIGSIVRTANALGVSRVHVVGHKRWNRRGAMVTDRYLQVDHVETPEALADDCDQRGLTLIGIDNIEGSRSLEAATLPERACLAFGAESGGLSPEMVARCAEILHITQRGSTRSMNVGHAAAIAMWAWVVAYDVGVKDT